LRKKEKHKHSAVSIIATVMAASKPMLKENPPQVQQNNLLKEYFDEKELKFRHVSADQFADVWLRYDRDGNGFIEGDEMRLFFSELLEAIVPAELKKRMLKEEMDQLIAELRQSLDKNEDDKIDIAEVWKVFDKDKSGYIEADELKDFLKELFKQSPKGNTISEDKLIEYTDNILRIFDKNKDKKLQLSEMARLVPVKENFLRKPFFKSAEKITDDDIDRVFSYYDQDQNGYMQDEELAAFFKDLLELTQDDYDDEDLRCIKDAILSDWDANKDGKIYTDELKMMLRVQRQMSDK
uniref:Calbindin-32 n=1 Tax=Rodentolepis nana TaxID=102285 RepID=A0A0R3T0C8_RODNA